MNPAPARTAIASSTTTENRAGTRSPSKPGRYAYSHRYGTPTGNGQPPSDGRAPNERRSAATPMIAYSRTHGSDRRLPRGHKATEASASAMEPGNNSPSGPTGLSTCGNSVHNLIGARSPSLP